MTRPEANAGFFGRRVRTYDASQRVPIGDADGGKLQLGRLAHHFMGVRRAAQKREVGAGDKFGKRAHANSPCTYQRGSIPCP